MFEMSLATTHSYAHLGTRSCRLEMLLKTLAAYAR